MGAADVPHSEEFPLSQRRSSRGAENAFDLRFEAGSSLLFLLLLFPIALGARWSYPTWDDGLFHFQLHEVGAQVFQAVQGRDRPLLGWLLTFLAQRGIIWPVAIALHAITWFGTGLITARYWYKFFPGVRALGTVVGCLAMAPLVLQTQLILVYPIFTAHLGTVVCFAVCLLSTRTPGRPLTHVAIVVLSALLVLGACLISEYSVMATLLAAAALALAPEPAASPAHARRRRLPLLILAGTALLAYAIYHMAASAAARPEVRPEIQLTSRGFRPFLELPVRLPFAVWTGAMGELFNGFGEVLVYSGSLWGLAYGAVFAGLAYVVLGPSMRRYLRSEEKPPLSWRSVLALLVSVAVGQVPMILMSSSPQRNIASRGWFPFFPLVACLTGALLYTLMRRRFHLVVSLACMFLGAYLCANAAASARSIRTATDELAPVIREHMSPTGLTVALFLDYPANPFVGSPIARPYELTARLTRDWPEEDRKRFWAAAYNWPPLENFVSRLPAACGAIAAIDADVGGWVRKGPVARLVWVSRTPNGQFKVQEAAAACPSAH